MLCARSLTVTAPFRSARVALKKPESFAPSLSGFRCFALAPLRSRLRFGPRALALKKPRKVSLRRYRVSDALRPLPYGHGSVSVRALALKKPESFAPSLSGFRSFALAPLRSRLRFGPRACSEKAGKFRSVVIEFPMLCARSLTVTAPFRSARLL